MDLGKISAAIEAAKRAMEARIRAQQEAAAKLAEAMKAKAAAALAQKPPAAPAKAAPPQVDLSQDVFEGAKRNYSALGGDHPVLSNTAAAPAQPPTPEQKLEAARAEVEKAAKENPASVPAVFEQQAQTLEPAQLPEFIRQSREQLDAAARSAAEDKDGGRPHEVYAAFGRVAERGGDEAAKELAKIAAPHVPRNGDIGKIGEALHDSIGRGEGARFGAALVGELQAGGTKGVLDKQSVDAVTGAMADGLKDVRKQYESAQADVKRLEEELAHFTAAYKDVLSPEQMQQAVLAFKEKHKPKFERFEAAAKTFSTALDGAASLVDPKNPNALPEPPLGQPSLVGVLRAEAGATISAAFEPPVAQALKDELKSGLAGTGRTVLDVATDLSKVDRDAPVKVIQDWKSFSEKAGNAMLDVAASSAAEDPARAREFIGKVREHAGLFGNDEAKFKAVVDDIDALTVANANGNKAQVDEATAKLKRSLGSADNLFGANTSLGQATRGFALGVSVYGNVQAYAKWDKATLAERVKTIADTLEIGAGGTELLLGATNKLTAASAAGKFGGALGVAGALFEGLAATKAFSEGKILQGAGHTATAAGGLILAGASLGVSVPVAGQVIGVILIGVGTGLNQYAKVAEANKFEGPTKELLEMAGLSPKLANALANHSGEGKPVGPVIDELAKRTGLSRKQILDKLETLSPEQLDRVVEQGFHQVWQDDNSRPKEGRGGDAEQIRDWQEPGAFGKIINGGAGVIFGGNPLNDGRKVEPGGSNDLPPPRSVEGLAWWLQRQGFLPDGARLS